MSDQDQPQTELQEITAALRSYVTPDARTVVTDEGFVQDCAAEALALVTQLLGSTTPPAEIRRRAIIETGAALFQRRQAPNGISQYASPTGEPVRIARDPMNVARVILAGWLPVAFA